MYIHIMYTYVCIICKREERMSAMTLGVSAVRNAPTQVPSRSYGNVMTVFFSK